MTLVTLEIPDELAANFANIQELRRTLYEDFIIEQRQQGRLSLGEAAQLLGLTYSEFFTLLGKKGFSFINADQAALQASYDRFHTMMSREGE
ncbi:MAG TPA: UPF0175 family protein [Caldilineaceae bacterium]|nr:UPF0175 family protein [Caldilineaceae bacterium]